MRSAQLGDFCTLVQGGRHKLSGKNFVNSGYPAYGAGGINGFLTHAEFNRSGIVLSAIGARCGKCFLAEGDWSSLANTQIILPDPQRVDIFYLYYQLNDERRWPRRGVAQPFIRPSDVKAHLVYLPPLDEQRRIAAILGKADALCRKRKRTLELLDDLVRSCFSEMFGDADQNHKRLPVVSMGEIIIEGPSNGLYKPASAYGCGTPILRINNFYAGEIVDFRDLRRLDLEDNEITRFELHDGDIVINRVNSREYVGKSAIIPALNERTVYESNMMRLRVDPDAALPRFVVQSLQSKAIRRQIISKTKEAM